MNKSSSTLPHLEWPVCADGTEMRLGDRYEGVSTTTDKFGDVRREVGIVDSITFYSTRGDGFDSDNPKVMIGGGPIKFYPNEIRHRYSDSLEKIFNDVSTNTTDFAEFNARITEYVKRLQENQPIMTIDELREACS